MAEMTKEQRKMAVKVAKDVLKWITPNKAEAGTYLNRDSYDDKLSFAGLTDKQKAKLAQKNCKVCALGACFLSTVGLFNEFTFAGDSPYYVDHHQMRDRLRAIFDDQQMADIESAFEQQTMYSGSYDLSRKYGSMEAILFGQRYKTDIGRMKAIMNNIIKNNGEFIPSKKKAKKEEVAA